MKVDPRARLERGQKAAAAGRYEEALNEYLWFHEHALEHERAFYGVRLSFALAYWLELGKVYPPAMDALHDVRDRKTQALLNGEANRDMFHDVEAINETLGSEAATYELFIKLDAANSDFAARCASLAMPAIVKSKDFRLARRYMPAPERRLKHFCDMLNEDVENLERERPSDAPRLEAYVHNYAEQVKLLVSILRGANEPDEAERIRHLALDFIKVPAVREAVRNALRNVA